MKKEEEKNFELNVNEKLFISKVRESRVSIKQYLIALNELGEISNSKGSFTLKGSAEFYHINKFFEILFKDVCQ